jgi:hypothetical protein
VAAPQTNTTLAGIPSVQHTRRAPNGRPMASRRGMSLRGASISADARGFPRGEQVTILRIFHKRRGQRIPPIRGCDIGVTPSGVTGDVIPAGAIDSTAWRIAALNARPGCSSRVTRLDAAGVDDPVRQPSADWDW